jgi:hypothetical protein
VRHLYRTACDAVIGGNKMRNYSLQLEELLERNLRRTFSCLFPLLSCLFSLLISAYADGKEGLELKFVTEKHDYLIGEPVVLNLVASNSSKSNIFFDGEDNFGFVGYRFKGVRDKKNFAKSFDDYMRADGLLIPGTRFDCQPGAIVHEQIVLQRFLDLSEPGNHMVSCEFCTIVSPHDIVVFTREDGLISLYSNKWTVISNEVSIDLSPFDEAKILNVAKDLFRKLLDADVQTRRDAAEALGYFSGSDAVVSNVINLLVSVPADADKKVKVEVEKAIGRLKGKLESRNSDTDDVQDESNAQKKNNVSISPNGK